MQYINSCCKKEQRANILRCEKKQFHPFKLLTKKSTRWHRTDIMLAVACMATWRTKSVSSVQSVDKKRCSRALIISVVPFVKNKKLPHFLKFFLFVAIL